MHLPHLISRGLPVLLAAMGLILTSSADIAACPFCSVASQTLSEEQQSTDAVVLAKLVQEAAPSGPATDGFDGSDPSTVISTTGSPSATTGRATRIASIALTNR